MTAIGRAVTGDDWALGTRATITLAEGLETDLIYAYQFADCGAEAKQDEPRCALY